MARLFDAPLPVMVARVDFLVPQDGGAPRALELNATIPAMPAYADLAAFSWLRAAARERGLSPRAERALVARCGSHMERLREALVAVHRARGGTRERPSIAIVARPGDAQIGELRRLVAHLRQMGHEAAHLVPAECEPERWDVLYRHVWAHRVDPADAVRPRAARPGPVRPREPGERAARGEGALRPALGVRRGRGPRRARRARRGGARGRGAAALDPAARRGARAAAPRRARGVRAEAELGLRREERRPRRRARARGVGARGRGARSRTRAAAGSSRRSGSSRSAARRRGSRRRA